jgi:hypothetical protein
MTIRDWLPNRRRNSRAALNRPDQQPLVHVPALDRTDRLPEDISTGERGGSQMQTGTVKWFKAQKSFGFIHWGN